MCCIITSFIFFGPRVAILIWWLINPLRFNLAFTSWIWPLLFAVFAPFTMIMYLIAWSPGTGITGISWLWIGLGIFLDILSYTGGGVGNRRRFRRI
jgi:hypothetical protein